MVSAELANLMAKCEASAFGPDYPWHPTSLTFPVYCCHCGIKEPPHGIEYNIARPKHEGHLVKNDYWCLLCTDCVRRLGLIW